MADFVYRRDPQRFYFLGMDLNRPIDALKPLHAAMLKNVRMYQTGRIEARPGESLYCTSGNGGHSIRRLNDPLTSTYTYIVGANTTLYYGTTSVTSCDSGYSGDPLAMIPYRPEQSEHSWLYLGDSSRMRKVNVSGTVHQIAMPRPETPPLASLSAQAFKVIDNCDATTNWSVPAGGSNAITVDTDVYIDTTISQIVYDSGTTGWCSINPASLADIGPGSLIIIDDGGGSEEEVSVQSVLQGSSTSTTIARIEYESGSTGYCSIVLTSSLQGITTGSLIYDSTVSTDKYAIVESIVPELTGTSFCIRLSTASTWADSDTIQLLDTVRCYTTLTHATTETITSPSLLATLDTLTDSTGYAQKDLSSSPIDLSSIDSTHFTTIDDYIHISLYFPGSASFLTGLSGKLMLDVADDNTFLYNYWYAPFNYQTFGTPNSGMGWVEVFFRIGDFIHGGSSTLTLGATDIINALKNVYHIRLSVTSTVTSFNIRFNSISLVGGGGPDTGIGDPYIYRYRARCTATGAVSDWSPATRNGMDARRQPISVVAPAQYTLATEADVLDIQRWGGTLPEWRYIGTVDNSASPVTFTDNFPDDVVASMPSESAVNQQPWPILGHKLTGTANLICGYLIQLNSLLPYTLVPGSEIHIGNGTYTVRRTVSINYGTSVTDLELDQSAGAPATLTWTMPEPIYSGVPLPCLWGPVDETLFACGDLYNPQRLYFTIPNTESSVQTNYIDITSPSEPLQNGVVHNGRCYVWSTERMFQIVPSNNENIWTYAEIPSSVGLFHRWAISGLQGQTGPVIVYEGRNGIFGTDGATPTSMTADTLSPLFPHDGQPGFDVNTIPAPDYTKPSTDFRISYYDDCYYYDYRSASSFGTLIYVTNLMEGRGGWFFDTYWYSPSVHYGIEGSGAHGILMLADNRIYQLTGYCDGSSTNNISGYIRTGARNQGDSRLLKLYGDIAVDCLTNGVSVTATPYFDNFTVTGTPTTLNTSTRDIVPLNVASAWESYSNIGLDLTWSSATARPYFYLWEPRWHEEGAPIEALSWENCETAFEGEGFMYTGDMYLTYISTSTISLTFTIDNTAYPAIVFPSTNGLVSKTYTRLPVMKGKMWTLRFSSPTRFRVHGGDCELRVKQWGGDGPWKSVRLFQEISTGGATQPEAPA
jgi:hypothetical protein